MATLSQCKPFEVSISSHFLYLIPTLATHTHNHTNTGHTHPSRGPEDMCRPSRQTPLRQNPQPPCTAISPQAPSPPEFSVTQQVFPGQFLYVPTPSAKEKETNTAPTLGQSQGHTTRDKQRSQPRATGARTRRKAGGLPKEGPHSLRHQQTGWKVGPMTHSAALDPPPAPDMPDPHRSFL